MAVLDGRRSKKNAMATQWQLFPSEGTRTEGFLLCPHENFSSTQLEQKASPDEEDEEV